MEHARTPGFTERRLARLGGGTDTPGLFPTRFHHPAPSPDGTRLAWISDRDGRPHAWVGLLPPEGKQVEQPDRPLPTGGDVETMCWSPDGLWIACQIAPHGGERTGVQVVSPDGEQVRDLAPGAAAATLGVWSPTGRQLGITIFAESSGDGQACLVDLRDGTSVVLASGPRRTCAR
ncbi:hypothetical protein BJF90_28225 [Pseudonocardia sp. CNS-004]|nr:hypothetical protein BJF90_28225 [Pseudonocardia sp. CNS-004]